MADPLPDGDAGTPRWVKVAGVVAVAVVVLIVVAILTGRHDGPDRHAAPESAPGHSAQQQ
jgi:hypothetical protein